MSKIRTIYNPGVGIVYFIKNTKTGEEIEASTLTTRDADQKPWRSPRGTLEGQEFFKMKSGSKKIGFSYYTFMNSIKNDQCLSSDGEWLFTARKPSGNIIQKLVDIIKKEKVASTESEFSGNQIRYKVDKINTESIPMSDESIKEKINSISTDDFSANDQLLELLSKESQ